MSSTGQSGMKVLAASRIGWGQSGWRAKARAACACLLHHGIIVIGTPVAAGVVAGFDLGRAKLGKVDMDQGLDYHDFAIRRFYHGLKTIGEAGAWRIRARLLRPALPGAASYA